MLRMLALSSRLSGMHANPVTTTVGQQHHQRRTRPCPRPDPNRDAATSYAVPTLSPPHWPQPPDDRQDRRDQDRRELARKRQAAHRGRRPEPTPSAAGQEPPEEKKHARRGSDTRQLHRHQAAVGDQVRAEREEPGRQGHRPRAVQQPAPAGARAQRDEPDPRRPRRGPAARALPGGRSGRRSSRRGPSRSSTQSTGACWSFQKRSGEPMRVISRLLAGPPPAGGDAQVGDLVVGRRAAARIESDQQRPGPTSRGGNGQDRAKARLVAAWSVLVRRRWRPSPIACISQRLGELAT